MLSLNFTFQALSIVALLSLSGCPKPKQAIEKKAMDVTVIEASQTAMGVIRQVRKGLASNCGRDLAIDPKGLSELVLHDPDVEEAEDLLANIGLMAQQCGDYTAPLEEVAATCNPDCHWCPVKWYWCIENAGACAGGDNQSCCKLGACGSKHHCEAVCKSSCGCDVPPLPADGGGGGEE